MVQVILFVHAAATWFMVGLIWFVQVVHYPLFASVGAAEYARYQHRHQRLTTLVVGPFMIIELLCAAWLVIDRHTMVDPALAWSGFALLSHLDLYGVHSSPMSSEADTRI